MNDSIVSGVELRRSRKRKQCSHCHGFIAPWTQYALSAGAYPMHIDCAADPGRVFQAVSL